MQKVSTITLAQSERRTGVTEALPAPQGIGMAVTFDWGLTVQFLCTPLLPLFFHYAVPLKILGLTPSLPMPVYLLTSIPLVVFLVLLGEGGRRGRRWAWGLQLVANVLFTLLGLSRLGSYWHAIQIGHYWDLFTAVILLVFAPLVVWRLIRAPTRSWFQRVSSEQARQRHGGLWPWSIALCALVFGIAQTLVSLFH